ncbi:MAG: hypothetical protein H6712_19015 [Myxococcales bacterium]|nr:hypothetical protein [Myxococcales bacterium]MCB9715966.1 hypothetical protein [Myxococcales bacterium]
MRGAWLGACLVTMACALGAEGSDEAAPPPPMGSDGATGTGAATGDAGSTTSGASTSADATGASSGGCEPTLWWPDGDEDGHGEPGSPVSSCEAPAGHAPLGDDCDDQDPEIHPGFTEECDGKDNDCDGLLDEASAENPSCHGCELLEHGGHAYAVCAGDATWDEARTACQGDFAADLLVLDDQAEHDAVVAVASGLLVAELWIGASDVATEGAFVWVDGSPLGWTHWFIDQPDDFLGLEDCVEMREDFAYAWNDYPCDQALGWVCEAG